MNLDVVGLILVLQLFWLVNHILRQNLNLFDRGLDNQKLHQTHNIKSNVNKLPISDLIRNKFQPRKKFVEEDLNNLTNSIRQRGIIQPIIVRKSQDEKTKHEIIAGERRWLAAQKAGLHEVPVLVIEAEYYCIFPLAHHLGVMWIYH